MKSGLLWKASGLYSLPEYDAHPDISLSRAVLKGLNVQNDITEELYFDDNCVPSETRWSVVCEGSALRFCVNDLKYTVNVNFHTLDSHGVALPTAVSAQEQDSALEHLCVFVWFGPNVTDVPVLCTENALTTPRTEGWFAFCTQSGMASHSRGYMGVVDAKGTAYLLPPMCDIKQHTKGRLVSLTGEKKRMHYCEDEDVRGTVLIHQEKRANGAFTPRYINMAKGEKAGHLLVSVSGLDVAGKEPCVVLDIDTASKSYEVVRVWECTHTVLPPIYVPELSLFLKPLDETTYSIIPCGDSEEKSPLGRLLVTRSGGYAIVLSNGHYAGTPGCESFLQFSESGKHIGMEALAPWRNRPAEVLAALNGNADDIAALRETTKRWLRKKGYDAENMPPEPSLSALPVAKVDIPPLYASSAQLEFRVELQASARPIQAVKVLADGVNVSRYVPVSVPAGEKRSVTVQVPLVEGQNWLEVSPEDADGTQGETTRFRVISPQKTKPQLYVLALGVSQYQDENLRLQYAAKDAQDVADAFRNMNNGNNHVLCLTDDKVRKEDALNKMEGFLTAANIDDIVVVYIAGHGFLDEQLNYYYAPADTDVDRLAESAISMDDLSSGVQACGFGRRLLLMDTCHAGMVGEEGAEQLTALGMNLPQGVRAVQTRGMKVKGTPALRTDAARKRYIEEMYSADSTQRGINIIAGSAGAEFARESDRWNNGVFTAVLLEALEGTADADGDGKLTVAELARHLRREVAEQTNNAQKPDLVAKENDGDMELCSVSHPETMPSRSGKDEVSSSSAFQLTEATAGEIVRQYLHAGDTLESAAMAAVYADLITNLTDGTVQTREENLKESLDYASRWPVRRYDVAAVAYSGNTIEVQMRYTCTNVKGKTVRGFSKATLRVDAAGKIDGVADESSLKAMPAFSAGMTQGTGRVSSAPAASSAAMLTDASVRAFVQRYLSAGETLSPSEMEALYEREIANFSDGSTMTFEQNMQESRDYAGRWPVRRYDVQAVAYSERTIEIQMRYTCTNTKGKTVRGFSKATLHLSPAGRIDGVGDESSTKVMPAFSSGMRSIAW